MGAGHGHRLHFHGHSPIHRAVWDQEFPAELFLPSPSVTPADCERVMGRSLDLVAEKPVIGPTLTNVDCTTLGRADRKRGRTAALRVGAASPVSWTYPQGAGTWLGRVLRASGRR